MEDSVEVKTGSDPTEFDKDKKPEKEEEEEDEDNSILHHEKYGMREIIIPLGTSEIRFNPLTSLFAIAFLWGRK